jgi:hypothetical protein
MSLYVALIVMSLAGAGGGLINALMKREPHIDKASQPKIINRIVIGVGAAFLVPLFLEIASSKILDGIHCDWNLCVDKIKDYLLFFAYCLLAAMAGPQFIKNLIKNVIKAEEFDKVNRELKQQQKKEKIKKKESMSLAQKDEQVELEKISKSIEPILFQKLTVALIAKVGVVNPEDTQKGRFGGQTEANERSLDARIYKIADEYYVDAWVESTNADKPLEGYVIFYLHDSFRPSVRAVWATKGKAELLHVRSIGTYTIGAVADYGDTFLEYDLSKNPDATEEFKSI